MANLRSADQLLRAHLRRRQEDRPEGRLHRPVLHHSLLAQRLNLFASPRPESSTGDPAKRSPRRLGSRRNRARGLMMFGASLIALLFGAPALGADVRPLEDAPLFAIQFVDNREGWA